MSEIGNAYDLAGIGLHPGLTLVCGQMQSGKTSFMNYVQDAWHAHGPKGGRTLALDGVCVDPPKNKHLAAWSTYWTSRAPDYVPDDVSLVLCDEAAVFLSNSKDRSPVMWDLAARGQHFHKGRGCSAVFGSQRITDFPTGIRANAKRWVFFKTVSVPDLEWLAKNVPGLTDLHIQMLPMLPPGYCVIIDEGTVYTPRVAEWAELAR